MLLNPTEPDDVPATRIIERLALEKQAVADQLEGTRAVLFALASMHAEKGKVRIPKVDVVAGAKVAELDVKILKTGSVVLTLTYKPEADAGAT